MKFEIKKHGKLLLMNNYSFIIKKISGFSLLYMKEENGEKPIPALSIFFDGIKLDFKNENKKMLEEAYKKLIEILSEC